jgi:hypothetical protein
MPAQSIRQSRRSQAHRVLTFDQAVEHDVVKRAIGAEQEEWRKRQDKRLRRYRSNPKAAANPEIYRKAARAEFKTKDLEPTAQTFLTDKLQSRRLPFFVLDAIGNLVKGDLADLQDAIRHGKHRNILIYAGDLREACGETINPGGRRPGRPPVQAIRVARAMRRDRDNGVELKGWTQEALAEEYGCNRETAVRALELALSEIDLPAISDTK